MDHKEKHSNPTDVVYLPHQLCLSDVTRIVPLIIDSYPTNQFIQQNILAQT